MKLTAFLLSAEQFIFTFLAFIGIMFSSIGNVETTYEAKNPQELIMSFSVVSDVHIETTNSDSYNRFVSILKGIKSGKDTSAAVFLGDNVMNGQFLENLLFYQTLKKIDPTSKNIVVMGNHDIGNNQGEYDGFIKSFLHFNKQIGNSIEKPYYYEVICGIYFVLIAPEEMTDNYCTMSETQLTWLNGVLDEADECDAPIFVFNHFPIYSLKGVERDSLVNLLCRYDNLLYIYGHTHLELDEDRFQNISGVDAIGLPTVKGGEYDDGIGIVIEVYEEEVIVRARNFIKNTWIEELEYIYPINK